ncbi:Hypothetical predicted protein [Paramuricea clavata]|uniref:Uncharacterized protein n=3 Tax=Paramuricea clavata TaxID=317549 RepID=A0A7D9LH32_PARCT|nr:Hypothetical predicted protein [Paramuricea clavata]
MVIVHNATAGSSIPSANFQTNNLGPFQENIQDLYVTAYLKADVLPLTFVIGDGKEYNSEKQKYFNQPLKQNSSYIVFLRFFESNDSYYSTEWSSSVKTMVKPPEEYIERRSTEQSTGDKTFMELLIPLVIACLCFLLSLCVNIYQRRLIQNNGRHAKHRSQTSKQAHRTQNLDSKSMKGFEGAQKGSYVNDDTLYETPDEVLESVERNCTGSRPDNSTGQEPSTYMSLKDNQEPENFYQPLQAPGTGACPDHTKGGDQRIQTMQYENLAFKANFSGE